MALALSSSFEVIDPRFGCDLAAGSATLVVLAAPALDGRDHGIAGLAAVAT